MQNARCGAKTRSGATCKHEAGWGTQHVGVGRCKLHGGSTPYGQVNGVLELARREQVVMGAPIRISPQDAILECIAIAAGEVRYCSDMVAELSAAEAVGPVTTSMLRVAVDGAEDQADEDASAPELVTAAETRYGPPQLHIWILARDRALDRLMLYTTAALKLHIEERLVRIAEGQAALLAQAVKGILSDLGVQDHPEAPSIVRRHLTLLAGGPVPDRGGHSGPAAARARRRGARAAADGA